VLSIHIGPEHWIATMLDVQLSVAVWYSCCVKCGNADVRGTCDQIPASAVEMPASMNSAQLDVQFGNWDAVPAAGVPASAESASAISFTADVASQQQAHYGPAAHRYCSPLLTIVLTVVTSAKEVMFLLVFVCLCVSKITQKVIDRSF